MSKEYIERDVLIAEYDRVHVGEPGGARKLMEDAPAADVVEVVRCRECRYWDTLKNPKHKGVGICSPPNPSLGGYCTRRGATRANDYCSYGERKGGAE